MANLGEEEKVQQVREFLSALSPSELRRIVELFRAQMGMESIPENVQPYITPQGLPRMLPGTMAAKAGKL